MTKQEYVFEKGNLVICVEDYASNGFLSKEQEYVVVDYNTATDEVRVVDNSGFPTFYEGKRFRLVKNV